MAEKQKTIYELSAKKTHYKIPDTLLGVLDGTAKDLEELAQSCTYEKPRVYKVNLPEDSGYKSKKKEEKEVASLLKARKFKNVRAKINDKLNDNVGWKIVTKSSLSDIHDIRNPLNSETFQYLALGSFSLITNDNYINYFLGEHKTYENFTQVEDFLQEQVRNKVIQQLGADKLYTTRGIYFSKNSKPSSKIAYTKDIKELVAKNANKLLEGKVINTSICFYSLNMLLAIKHADILYMTINIDGEIEFYVLDTYDFNKGEKDPLVRFGRKLQEQGKIVPYFSIHHVVIPKEKSEEYLRDGMKGVNYETNNY